LDFLRNRLYCFVNKTIATTVLKNKDHERRNTNEKNSNHFGGYERFRELMALKKLRQQKRRQDPKNRGHSVQKE